MARISLLRVGKDGRVTLPKAAREALGVLGGGAVAVSLEAGQVTLASREKSIKHAQTLYRQYATIAISVDGFLSERRTEAARDAQD